MFCLQDGAVGWKPQHFEKQPDGKPEKILDRNHPISRMEQNASQTEMKRLSQYCTTEADQKYRIRTSFIIQGRFTNV